MKVLLIHQVFVPPSEAGGTRHYEFGKFLAKQGHEFTIVASNLSYLTGKRATEKRGFINVEMLDGIRVFRAYTYPSLHKSFTWRVVSFLSFMFSSLVAGLRAGPIDIVMGTSPPIFQAVSAWVIAAIRNKPFLLEVRDLWPEFAIDMGVLKSRVLVAMSRWLEAFLYNRATHILVNSPAYRDYLLKRGVSPEKISCIPNGVDPQAFGGDRGGETFRQQLGVNGAFLAMYAGALGMANDIPTILRAAKRLANRPEIRFVIVGDGKERANLMGLAESLSLNNVIFTGARPKAEMPGILGTSDACLATLLDIPMFKTTYPNKVFDYMASGKPTVLAIDGVIRKVIEEARGGIYVPPGNPEALAEAILWLSENRSKARDMGEAAREHVIRCFNRNTHAQEFGALCAKMVGKRS